MLDSLPFRSIGLRSDKLSEVGPISRQQHAGARGDTRTKVRKGRAAASAYDFDRLETAVKALAESRGELRAENDKLRAQLEEQAQRIQILDERLLESNQRRQDAVRRVDALVARLDQLDAEFASEVEGTGRGR